MEVLEMIASVNPAFWRNKKVFLTGHTGFKGGWLSIWLEAMGAKVIGYSLKPQSVLNLFTLAGVENLCVHSEINDLRNLERLQNLMSESRPEIVIHMAAQSLVRHSYSNPVETFETNILGTVNLLEAVRRSDSVRAVLVITSDKCYENLGRDRSYREDDAMGGYDPYSSSKGCAELVASSYARSFFSESGAASVATCRAGNVIGGGDWSRDRLIPDAVAAFMAHKTLIVRKPFAVRPWQHVLEPLSGYLVLAEKLFTDGSRFSGPWNFGPKDRDARPVKELIELLIGYWSPSVSWEIDNSNQPHEAHFLKLDCSKANKQLGWHPKWSLEVALKAVVDWHQEFSNDGDILKFTRGQIREYLLS